MKQKTYLLYLFLLLPIFGFGQIPKGTISVKNDFQFNFLFQPKKESRSRLNKNFAIIFPEINFFPFRNFAIGGSFSYQQLEVNRFIGFVSGFNHLVTETKTLKSDVFLKQYAGNDKALAFVSLNGAHIKVTSNRTSLKRNTFILSAAFGLRYNFNQRISLESSISRPILYKNYDEAFIKDLVLESSLFLNFNVPKSTPEIFSYPNDFWKSGNFVFNLGYSQDMKFRKKEGRGYGILDLDLSIGTIINNRFIWHTHFFWNRQRERTENLHDFGFGLSFEFFFPLSEKWFFTPNFGITFLGQNSVDFISRPKGQNGVLYNNLELKGLLNFNTLFSFGLEFNYGKFFNHVYDEQLSTNPFVGYEYFFSKNLSFESRLTFEFGNTQVIRDFGRWNRSFKTLYLDFGFNILIEGQRHRENYADDFY